MLFFILSYYVNCLWCHQHPEIFFLEILFCLREYKKVSWHEAVWIMWLALPHHAMIHEEVLHNHGRMSTCQQLMEQTLRKPFSLPSSWRIRQIIFKLICSWFSVCFMVLQCSLATSSLTFATVSIFRALDGCPVLVLYSRFLGCFLNL